MKKQRLKLSLNKIKIASINNLKKMRGGSGTQNECNFQGNVIMILNEISCLNEV